MSVQTIPYGDRAILVSDSFVYICDEVLLRSDFSSDEALMARVQEIYEAYRADAAGEAATLYRQYQQALRKAKGDGGP